MDADFPRLNSEWQVAKSHHAGIMKLPPQLYGYALISFGVNELSFYYKADIGDAIDYETEIMNTLIYL
jgi:hypothetical protein